MKLLNLCAGANRSQAEEWYNLDQLHPVLAPGTPERIQLDSEPRYTEHDVLSDALPFAPDTFDGILASHCVEHWTCQEAVRVMQNCFRMLKPGGILMVSVPDASYFRKVHDEDTVENAQRLFGEPIHLPDGEDTFMGYGLFNRFHKAVLTEDALWCYFVRAGFDYPGSWRPPFAHPVNMEMAKLLNRLPFSLIMMGHKA